ncbi:hypothetical protein C8Q74DRAFT_1216894 [Fomes fomentarius]|nr:hypothetical protein C8Q74DRAFT_1216894 [Fomes fomentarius]
MPSPPALWILTTHRALPTGEEPLSMEYVDGSATLKLQNVQGILVNQGEEEEQQQQQQSSGYDHQIGLVNRDDWHLEIQFELTPQGYVKGLEIDLHLIQGFNIYDLDALPSRDVPTLISSRLERLTLWVISFWYPQRRISGEFSNLHTLRLNMYLGDVPIMELSEFLEVLKDAKRL